MLIQRMRSRILGGLVTVLALPGLVAAEKVIANGGLQHTLMAAPVTGQPFSAVQSQQTIQTLADGSQVKHHGRHFVARDSSGRVRIEQNLKKGPDGKVTLKMVYVLDPIARTLSTFAVGDVPDKVAVTIKLPAEWPCECETADDKPKRLSSQEAMRPQPKISTEKLGTDIVDSLPVEVEKTTTVVPPGRGGNESPIIKTHEVWTSKDLKLVLKEQWEDPRTGVRTVQLDDFNRAEPDAEMFRVPRGYKVKDLKQTLKELADRLEAAQSSM